MHLPGRVHLTDLSNYLIANYCIQTKQFDRAEKILQPLLKTGISQNMYQGAAIYLEHMLFSIDSAKGHLKSAITHLSKYQREKDSVR